MSRRLATLLVAVLLVAGLTTLVSVLPVPYVALGPGPVTDTLGSVGGKPLIAVTGRRTYPTSGHLDLTTVSVSGGPPAPMDLGLAVRGWLDKHTAVVPQELIYPPDTNAGQVEQQNTKDMVTSQEHATTAALRSLRIPVRTSVEVRTVTKGAPAAGRLRVGDVLRTVNKARVTSVTSLRLLISRHPVGTRLTLGVVRGGRPVSVRLRSAADPTDARHAVIGVEPVERNTYPFTVRIGLKDVGGPSAGLMFAVGIVDKLTPGALTGGRFVAGTGTIDDSGAVGPIGGVQQKIAAARAAGATIFLTPAKDCAAAVRTRPAGLELVRVTSLTGALAALRALDADPSRVPACTP